MKNKLKSWRPGEQKSIPKKNPIYNESNWTILSIFVLQDESLRNSAQIRFFSGSFADNIEERIFHDNVNNVQEFFFKENIPIIVEIKGIK